MMDADEATLVLAEGERIPVTDITLTPTERPMKRFITPEDQGDDAMAQDSRPNTAEDSRVQKARRIDVQEVYEPREGIYVVDFVNEQGEERQRVLIPSKIFSDSPDMIYRSNDGVVGKYLLAAARENEAIRADLALALEERQEDLDEQIQEAREQVESAAQEFNNIESARRALQADV